MKKLSSTVITRAAFDALLATRRSPRADGWSFPVDGDRDSVMVDVHGRTRVQFTRELGDHDYLRVCVDDVRGRLQTNAGPKELKVAEDICRRALAQIEQPAKKVPPVAIDRTALAAAVAAMIRGKPDKIVDAVMLAATDQEAYIARYRKQCAEFAIFEPIKGLHVIALLQHLPAKHLLYFDWKESMHDVLPMLVRVVRARGGTLDPRPFAGKLEGWDQGPRERAMKQLGRAIRGVELVQVTTESDALSYVCVPARSPIAEWRRHAQLPLSR